MEKVINTPTSIVWFILSTRFSEELLGEMFPDGSGDTSNESFAPAWYLLENHHQTRYADVGMSYPVVC